ncbi:response regulator transcription factor [Ruminiclostridium cellobioparum]|uniref:Stage 0 sporulation protein A homolog n=1 Tax=Ruminiclostridium cellobioparum subsp. termitidis CT1112 TaxID=1195236 RepID=S0FFU1_RUMCE|nr:response regulator transcription factor [Ruminiclostridium cellobioparum]EMS69562.1 two component transcriptional regulator, winged helix family protein [Ruminiclostridium cellobioparum subsp. termitidis CT1112]
MENKVLIVEDEESIRGFLKINFRKNDFIVIEAGSGEEGVDKARQERPSVVLLDVMLPGMDGFQVCEVLRKEFPDMGIIMLTARGQDIDRIKGLEFGADDYVLKPFNTTELILRAKSLLRRLGGNKANDRAETVNSGAFRIDVYSQRVFKDGTEIMLTPKEYLLLKLFLENQNKAFTRDELLDKIWGYDFIGDTKIVDVNIRRLRSKIEDKNSAAMYIETVWGTGYRWRKEQ